MINRFFDAWNDPAMRHAMVNHFPVVLSVIGIPFAVIAALMRGKDKSMRFTALAIYVALAVSGYVTRWSGQNAQDAVSGSLSDGAQALLEEHEALGDKVWIFAAGVTGLLGASFVTRPKLGIPAAWLAVAGSLFVAGWVANTADQGGRLVYEHGAGTPDDLAGVLQAVEASGESAGDPRLTFFRQRVQPILAENCLRCHNPRRAKRSGGLDQTTMARMLEGGWSGPAIVPGRPQESLLIEAVRWVDPDLQMPRGADKLADEQIAALERWIAQGAVWEPFEFTPRSDD